MESVNESATDLPLNESLQASQPVEGAPPVTDTPASPGRQRTEEDIILRRSEIFRAARRKYLPQVEECLRRTEACALRGIALAANERYNQRILTYDQKEPR